VSTPLPIHSIALYNKDDDDYTTTSEGGLNDHVYSVLVTPAQQSGSDLDVYVGGKFTSTFFFPDNPLSGFAKYYIDRDLPLNGLPVGSTDPERSTTTPTGGGWSTVGESGGVALDGPVGAIATGTGPSVFVGGEFTSAAAGQSIDLNNIAVYDNTSHSWTSVARKGLNGRVNALLLNGNDLYVGGSFTKTFDNSVSFLNGIAKYNVVTRVWTPLSDFGLNGEVRALALIGDGLYVGGDFTATVGGGTTGLNQIARYNITTGSWAPLSNGGLAGTVTGLAASGTNLYAAGTFTRTQDNTIVLNRIGTFDITANTWSPLNNNGLNGNVTSMGLDAGDLFMRGTFTSTFDNSTVLDRLAQYNLGTGQWEPITGTSNEREAAVRTAAAARLGHDRYVGGEFYISDPGVAQYFTVIYGQQWIPSPTLQELGIVSTDWFDPTNWNTGEVPAPNSNAAIPTGSGQIDILSADVTMNDLLVNGGTINIGAGRTLTINGGLSLGGGVITGAGTVVIAGCGPNGIFGGSSTSHIRTTLVRCVQAGRSYDFPVGTTSGYSPVFINNITGTGNVTVQPNVGQYSGSAAGLPVDRLGRWWQITNPGGVTEADLVFGYQQSDITGLEDAYRAYRISGGAATQIPSTINQFSNNVVVPNVTAFSDWTLAAAPSSVSGTVTYGNPVGTPTPRFVSNVTLTGEGSTPILTTTDFPGGGYTLTGFGSGSYTVTPSKTGGVNGAIRSFDAARIALHVAGPPNPQLNATQMTVADVSGNTSVTSFDAGMIAKFVAGPPHAPPGIGSTATWRFAPVSRNYASVAGSISGENYSALLMGEVSGNWTNSGARTTESAIIRQLAGGSGPERSIDVRLPHLAVATDKTIVVPVSVQNAAGKELISYEFDLRYDPSVIQPMAQPVELRGTVSRGLVVVTNGNEPGLLRVVVYGAASIGDGVLLNLRFSAVGSPGSVSFLFFERIMFNEGESQVSVTNGELRIEN